MALFRQMSNCFARKWTSESLLTTPKIAAAPESPPSPCPPRHRVARPAANRLRPGDGMRGRLRLVHAQLAHSVRVSKRPSPPGLHDAGTAHLTCAT